MTIFYNTGFLSQAPYFHLYFETSVVLTLIGDLIFFLDSLRVWTIRTGRSDEGNFGQDSGGVVTLLPAPVSLSLWHKARGQGSPQGAVKVKGLSLSKGAWSHHSDSTVHTICPVQFFSSPTFSNPSKWLGQNS